MSRPREGWLSFGLLLVMMLAVAWSVQAAGWLEHLEFLVPVALFSVLVGTGLALTRMRPSFALLISAVAGGAIVIWTVGGEYFRGEDQLGRVLALREELIGWIETVLVRGYPLQFTPYALALGVLLWVSGYVAAFSLFRRHRALDAVFVAGATLIANMSATYIDLFGYLVLFVLAALLLLLRAALAERQISWRARRVRETDEVPASMMRSGVAFVASSIVMAWVLTSVAVAAPLSDTWRNLDTVWSDVNSSLSHVFGSVQNPSSRLEGTAFGPSFNINGTWVSRDDLVLEVASDRPYYLRTIAYDHYTGRGWELTGPTPRQVEVEQPFFPGESFEEPWVTEAFERVTITVEIETPNGRNLFTPGSPVLAFLPVVLQETQGLPLFGGLEAASPIRPGDGYQITADISQATEAQLASAGTDYPEAVTRLYLGTEGVTDATRELARRIVAEAEAADPYHAAKALATWLQSNPDLGYETDVPLPSDPRRDLVDFFLFDDAGKRGYCQFYASAMVVMARSVGLPARMAAGFAPGARGENGVFEVRERDAHAWAEIYFPGYGWQIFESTKTINPRFVREPGTAPSPGGPGSAPQPDPQDRRDDSDLGIISTLPSFQPAAGGRSLSDAPAAERARGGNALVIAFLALAGGAVALYLVQRSRRRWRLLPVTDRAWREVEQAAQRAGVEPRPAETVYEYAGWLSEQLPSRRPEIRTVAHGKVWADYSGRPTAVDDQALIQRAWRRLRVPLWLLVIRRRVEALLRGASGR